MFVCAYGGSPLYAVIVQQASKTTTLHRRDCCFSPIATLMAILISQHLSMSHPLKRQRRSATTVLAGEFDFRPARDVLTSLLNGVAPYKVVEKDEETRRNKKREKRERDRERRRAKAAAKAQEKSAAFDAIPMAAPVPPAITPVVQPPASGTSSFWRGRPSIHIATLQRSVSVTPPPMPPSPHMPSSPASTPGPSSSSSTSGTSSKRPRTPNDDEDLDREQHPSDTVAQQQARKKRVAVKKGWKGWVEGSPPPSEKLINLDAVPVLQERRTRSGKSFDAIGVGKEGWV